MILASAVPTDRDVPTPVAYLDLVACTSNILLLFGPDPPTRPRKQSSSRPTIRNPAPPYHHPRARPDLALPHSRLRLRVAPSETRARISRSEWKRTSAPLEVELKIRMQIGQRPLCE